MSMKNKPGYGGLFANKPKDGESLHPDAPGYTGRATCPCCQRELAMSAWVKTAGPEAKHPGMQFMNLKLQPTTNGQ
jgi:hypothetical protein